MLNKDKPDKLTYHITQCISYYSVYKPVSAVKLSKDKSESAVQQKASEEYGEGRISEKNIFCRKMTCGK